MDKSEIDLLYRKLYPLLFNYGLKLTKNIEDTEDLIQDTMSKVILNSDKFIKGTNIKAWVITIMRNTFINNYNSKRNKITHFEYNDVIYELNGKTNTNNGYSNLVVEDINNLINKSNVNFIKCFDLYKKGYKMEEISIELDIPVGTVKSRIHFLRNNMKRRLKNEL